MDFKTPILITNFKAYQESTGARAVELAKIHEQVANELGVHLGVAGQAMDLALLAASTSMPVFAQHVDGVGYGAHTGAIPVEIAHILGVDGSILNHCECRISERQIEAAIEDLKRFGMLSLVCAENVEEGHRYAQMGANYVAIEPSELIGGCESVSSCRSELIQEAIQKIGAGKVIVGAGIKTGSDVRKALELGAVGVLVASGVVKAPSPLEALRNLCSGLLPS